MKGKSLIALAVFITAATLLFAACNKQNNNGTSGSETVTEEYQTKPPITSSVEVLEILTAEDGKPVIDENGKPVKVPKTTAYYRDVTDANGNKVTQTKVDNDGNPVTEENGQVVTEIVTEKVTEIVTRIEIKYPDAPQTMYDNVITTAKPTTTSLYDNPLYTDRETKKPTTPSEPKPDKNLASVSWIKPLDATKNDRFAKVVKVDAKSYIALCQTESTDGAFKSFSQTGFYSVLMKYDIDGKLLWSCPIGSTGHTKIHDIAVLKDGSIIAVGESNAKDLGYTPDGTFDAIIAKVSSSGKLSWVKNYGGTATETFLCVTATPDGGFVAAGKFLSSDGDFASLALESNTPVFVKCDANGAVKWFTAFNGNGSDSVNAVAADPDGNIYGACYINSTDLDAKGNHGSVDIGLIKISSTGSKLWTKMVGGSKSDTVSDIYADKNGCTFAGSYYSNNGDFTLNRGGEDAFIGFCDAQGNIKWIYTFGGLKNDAINAVVPTSFGYAAVGLSNSNNRDLQTIGNKGESDGFVMSVNSSGTLEHVKSFAGTVNDSVSDICKLDDKNYIVVGETYSNTNDFSSFKPSGCAGFFSKCYIY